MDVAERLLFFCCCCCRPGVYLHPNCTDNPFFANCRLIIKARYCTNKYYARFCCKSCTLAGQLPTTGPHLLDYKTGATTNGQ